MKRFLYILLIFLLCTVMVAVSGIMLLRSERVQTALTQLLTEELSRGLGVDVSVERVKLTFFNSLEVDGLYISDQTGDTLIYMPETRIAFNPFTIENQLLDFPRIEINDPYIYFKQDSNATNIDFLVRAFSSGNDSSSFDYNLSLDRFSLTNAKIRYSHLPTGRDIMASRINADVSLPFVGKDSIDAALAALDLRLQMRGVDAYVDGSFHGSFDTLFADNLNITYRGVRMLTGDVYIASPLQFDLAQAHVNCSDLYCNHSLLQDLLSDLLRHPVSMPQPLKGLGDIHYKGMLTGHLDSLLLHGAFITSAGTVTTDCVLSTDTTFSWIDFNGKVSSRRFLLSRLLPGKGFGRVSLNADLNAKYRKDLPLQARGKADITSFYYRQYTYRNIHINGRLSDDNFAGKVVSKDPNIAFSLNGDIALREQPMAKMMLRLEHLRTDELKLTRSGTNPDLSLTIDINLYTTAGKGNTLDRLNGYVKLDSIRIERNSKTLNVSEIDMTVASGDHSSFKLKNNFIQAGLSGDVAWSTMPVTIRRMAHKLLPRFIDAPKGLSDNDFDFYCYITDLDTLLTFFDMGDISIPYKQIIKGTMTESDGSYGLQFYVPQVGLGNHEIKDIAFNLAGENEQAMMAFKLLERTLDYDSTQLRIGDINMRLTTTVRNDSLLTTVNFSPEAGKDDEDIRINTHLSRYKNKPFVSVHIQPSSFVLRDTVWNLSDSHIEYAAADTTLAVTDFALYCPSQAIRATGMASTNDRDSIRIDLQHIELSYLMQYFGLEKALSANGPVSGWATLYSLFRQPVFEAKLLMPDAYLNHTSLGRLEATASLDHENHRVLIEADAVQDGHHIVHLDGNVRPLEHYWELFLDVDSTDLNLVNYWTEGIVDNISGRGYGNIHVFGRHLETWVTARLLAKNASLKVPFTGAEYHLTDSIILDTAAIVFPNVRLTDAEGHIGHIRGEVTHNAFEDFAYHLTASYNNLLAIDEPYSPQNIYYGKVYATGWLDLHGDKAGNYIDVRARTAPHSQFNLNVNSTSNATDNSFIEFVSEEPEELPESYLERKMLEKKKLEENKPKSKYELSLNIDATPDATVNVLLNSGNGDGLTGKGEGSLRLLMDESNGVKMYGTYTLQSGSFAYTVGRIIRRDFLIADGSTVSWSGDPLQPVLNVTAKYKVTASLRDLFGDDITQLATDRTSVPVECMLYITDRLFNPVLRFGIELPQSDEAVASQVRSVINSDEMLMRQVVYLLVFNRFFTPEYMQNTSSAANDTYSLLSSTLTGQVNAWLSRLTDIVQVGFNFRTDGEGASASQEYETQFQIHPVNRLSINGNFGYRYNDISNRPFYGDVDVEYQLTRDGKLRAKAFTHTVDKYSLKQASTVQGVGLIFRHDFNIGEKKKKKSKNTK